MNYSLRSVAEKVRSLQSASATNDKIALLKEYLQDDIFRRCFVAAYSESTDFKINKLKFREGLISAQDAARHFGFSELSKDIILLVLKRISKQKGVSALDKMHLATLASVDKDTFSVVLMICNKDMNCKVSATTLNKAVPGLIKITPYQRCSTMSAFGNISFEPKAIIQCKANGLFAYCIVRNVQGKPKIMFKSRRGNIIHQLDRLKEKLCNPIVNSDKKIQHIFAASKEEVVLMGELRVFEHNKTIMSRTKGNGIISSCISGTADAEYLDNIFYTIWDCIPLSDYERAESPREYRRRFLDALNYVNAVGNREVLQLIPTRYVETKQEANDFYKEMIAQGEEGAIIKNLTATWKNNTSTDMVKMKPIMEVELRIVSVTEHTKQKGWMGSLVLESEDRVVRVNCGSGFTEKQRQEDWSAHIGKVVSIEAESLIQDKRTRAYSLYLPVFIELRVDKTKANTFEEIQAMEVRPEGREKHITSAHPEE